MAVSPINSQASQAATLVNAFSTSSNVSTTVTSTDPAVLKIQVNRLSNAIAQLQNSGGSSQQIQKLNQAMQTAKDQINKQQQLAEEKQASNQSSNQDLTKGVNVKV